MKKRVISILAIAALLVASIAIPCIAADEQNIGASVEVTEFIDISISDTGDDGIQFGSWASGSDNVSDESQGIGIPSVTITVNPTTNTNIDLLIAGTDFSDGIHTIPISNVYYSDDNDGVQIAMSTANSTIKSGVVSDSTVGIWHWLDIPDDAAAGSYSTTFTYSAVPSP